MPCQSFRLTKEILGIVRGARLIIIPSGALVTVMPESRSGKMVRLLYDGQEAVVFEQDLKERTAPDIQRALAPHKL